MKNLVVVVLCSAHLCLNAAQAGSGLNPVFDLDDYALIRTVKADAPYKIETPFEDAALKIVLLEASSAKVPAQFKTVENIGYFQWMGRQLGVDRTPTNRCDEILDASFRLTGCAQVRDEIKKLAAAATNLAYGHYATATNRIMAELSPEDTDEVLSLLTKKAQAQPSRRPSFLAAQQLLSRRPEFLAALQRLAPHDLPNRKEAPQREGE